MSSFRRLGFLALVAAAVGAGAIAPRPLAAQDQAVTTAAPSAAVEMPATRVESADRALPGPRLAPQRAPITPLLPGESRERELNVNAARRETITIPVITLLLGIIILILLVD